MQYRSWLIAALGLGSLLLLTTLSMLASASRAREIYEQLDQLNRHHQQVETSLRRLRSDVNLSGIFVRDYLLDASSERAIYNRNRLAEFRRTNMAALDQLDDLLGHSREVATLRENLNQYWQAFDPLFDWTPAEKLLRSPSFLRRAVVPRRDAALAIAEEIEQLNNASLAEQRREVASRSDAFRADLRHLLWQTIALGLIVAAVVVIRLRMLERRSSEAEEETRRLSRQLVVAQEDERKHLARELHDHVAQTLTGLRMELGRIERLSALVRPAVSECKTLVDSIFLTVRTLSLGLRPAMLDDFGLQAALEWHARDFMGRYAIAVELNTTGNVDSLPEAHRTCVYRVIQEALTNCARHASATAVRIDVASRVGRLDVMVKDNGIGVDRGARRKGLGLRGIAERVRDLEGTMEITGRPRRGTRLTIRLPIPVNEGAAHASADC